MVEGRSDQGFFLVCIHAIIVYYVLDIPQIKRTFSISKSPMKYICLDSQFTLSQQKTNFQRMSMVMLLLELAILSPSAEFKTAIIIVN